MSETAQLGTALARLEARWGSAAVRIGARWGTSSDVGEPLVAGALALVPAVVPPPAEVPADPLAAVDDEILPTGFSALDALLGMGGLPRGASATLRGGRSSGKTALALHLIAQAQARGAIAAFLDLGHTLDPLEAAGRGVDLRWLLVLRPRDAGEGFALADALLAGRQVDLLVVDLPRRPAARHQPALRRIVAQARRAQVRLVVLEMSLPSEPANATLAELSGLRLELEQRRWLRLGRDVVGRRVAVTVAKNRFGPPGRQTEIDIRYLVDGEHAVAAARLAATSVPVLTPQFATALPLAPHGAAAHASASRPLATSAQPPATIA